MSDTVLTLTQALQLAALGPCLFLVAFLALSMRDARQVMVPILYFLALSCSLALPLMDAIRVASDETQLWQRGVLLLGESMIPSLSFLLVMQFIQGRTPLPFYWLILALPVVGGGSITYATLMVNDDVCVYGGNLCLDPYSIKALYNLFSAALIFALLMAIFIRQAPGIDKDDRHRRHKHWLILSLVLLDLLVLATHLYHLADYISQRQAEFVIILMRIGYIYLVLMSIFKVFDRQFTIDTERVPAARPFVVTDEDTLLAEKLKLKLEGERVYREMALSREKLATMLNVGEHQLSKIINRVFGKNFHRLVNGYRVEEAKQRLTGESTAITVIAFEVGFNSLASFNRVFKEEAGMSPTEWREKKGGIG